MSASPADFLTTYCNDCHGAEKQKGDRRFDQLVLPVSKMDTLIELKDILDQLHLGDMPPKKAPQPSAPELKAFIEQVTQEMTLGRQKLASTGGSSVLRRLNRTEYLQTIGDLFSLNMAAFDPTTNFPRDQSAEHMENLGDVLKTSGYLLDQYLEAADQVVEKVFALQSQPVEQEWHFKGNFHPQVELSAAHKRLKNAFIGIYECMDTASHEGGYAYLSQFQKGVPQDGMYEIQVLAQAMNREHPYDPKIFGTDAREPFRLGVVPGDSKLGVLHHPQPLQPMLAELALRDDKAQWYTLRVWLNAGQTPRFVFPNGPEGARSSWGKIASYHKDKWPQYDEEGDGDLGIFLNRILSIVEGKVPHIRINEVKIRGPLYQQWPPASQQAVLGKEAFTQDKLREVLHTFADKAYRRPATPGEVERLVAVAEERLRTGHSALDGLKAGLKAALCSPAFLYLSQDSTQDQKLVRHALASRLSYFLWSSMPDEELLRHDLTKPEVLLSQTRRLLASPRADMFVAGFMDSWLNLRNLGGMPPDRNDFEEYYSKGFQEAFKKETRLFMRDLLDRDASLVNFLDSDYSFLNQALALHYEIGEISEPEKAHEFRRVTFTNRRRGGLLGMGSVLTITANGIETSPVTRGVFLLENLLGTPPPPPPDDVPAIDPDVRGAKSIRDLLSKHRESVNCSGCHQKIDPLGFALENFDPVGDWRNQIEKKKIDASGVLPSGEKFDGVSELKKLLVKRKDLFASMLTRKLLTYACGRRMDALDDPSIERIVAELPQSEYGLRSLVEAVVSSELFLRR